MNTAQTYSQTCRSCIEMSAMNLTNAGMANITFTPDINDFYSGHLVVDKQQTVIYCNAYIEELCGLSIEDIIHKPLSAFLSKSSKGFFSDNLLPQLLTDSFVSETQLTWLSENGDKTPIVANIMLREGGNSYWTLFGYANREKLYNDLISANETLEKQSEDLHKLASTDPLTGLLNRRELHNSAKKVMAQSIAQRSTFALLSLDIDDFKKINDAYGHPTGDKFLIGIANVLMASARSSDFVARVGGEEFVLILPNTNEKSAFKLAEKIRKKVSKMVIDNISITTSIGMVVSHEEGFVDFDTLVNLSDVALYQSKESGRNQTTVAHYDVSQAI